MVRGDNGVGGCGLQGSDVCGAASGPGLLALSRTASPTYSGSVPVENSERAGSAIPEPSVWHQIAISESWGRAGNHFQLHHRITMLHEPRITRTRSSVYQLVKVLRVSDSRYHFPKARPLQQHRVLE